MSRPFTPWPYQMLMIAHALDHPKCGLFVPMGMGKTSASLALIDYVTTILGQGPVLVIAPLAVAKTTWVLESRKWIQFQHLTVSCMAGRPPKLRERAFFTPADIYVINYEGLPWLNDFLDKIRKPWPYPVVIADESTRLKSYRKRSGSVRAAALAKHVDRMERFVALTGTPSPNGLQDLWGQLYFIDQGQRLGRSFSAYMNRWFRPEQVAADAAAVRWIPFKHSPEQIMNAIADVCLSVRAEDYFDIDKPRFVDVKVQLDDQAMKIYRNMERDMFVQLQSVDVEALNAAAKTMKCLQLASGALYTDEEHSFEVVHDAKLDALESILEEASGEPLLVAYQFVSDRQRLLKRFPQAKAFDKTPEMVHDFNAGQIPMLLVHPASAGHGISLQDGSSKLVVFSQWWNLEEYQQVIERIGPMRQIQAGHPRVVTVYNLIAEGTVDETVMKRKTTKASIQSLLMERMATQGFKENKR